MHDRDAGRGTRDALDRSFPGRRLEDRLTQLGIGAALGVVLWSCAWALAPFNVAEWWPQMALPVFAAAGALAWVIGWHRLVWILVALGALAVIILTETPIMAGPVHSMIRRDVLPPHVDAVVVLSGGGTADSLLDAITVDRLLGGIALLERDVSNTVIVTEPVVRIPSKRDQFRLLALAPSGTRVLVANDVHTTRDEAVKTAALARPLGIRSVAVVTSPLHTRRACATFEHVGFTVACVPAPDRTVAVETLGTTRDRLLAWQEWLYDRLAWAKYRRNGWL